MQPVTTYLGKWPQPPLQSISFLEQSVESIVKDHCCIILALSQLSFEINLTKSEMMNMNYGAVQFKRAVQNIELILEKILQ